MASEFDSVPRRVKGRSRFGFLESRSGVSSGVSEPDRCPLCRRPNYFPSDHHLIPKCRGGGETATICRDCHDVIHAFFSNKELETTYNTVEVLLENARFAAAILFLAKQDPQRRMRTRTAKDQRRRGRNG